METNILMESGTNELVLIILLFTIISVFKHQHLNISIQVDNILDNIHILYNYM